MKAKERFRRMGESRGAMGYPMHGANGIREYWPEWARAAYAWGWANGRYGWLRSVDNRK